MMILLMMLFSGAIGYGALTWLATVFGWETLLLSFIATGLFFAIAPHICRVRPKRNKYRREIFGTKANRRMSLALMFLSGSIGVASMLMLAKTIGWDTILYSVLFLIVSTAILPTVINYIRNHITNSSSLFIRR